MDEGQNTTTTKTKAMTSSVFITHNMLIDPAIQKKIIRRAINGKFGDNPKQPVHSLGSVKMPDGREVPVYLRHAADAVLLDDLDHVVLITRKHNPGAGLKALPGGFMDPVQGIDGATVGEKATTAALREAREETGISRRLLQGHKSFPSVTGLTIDLLTFVWRGMICGAPILKRATYLRYRPKAFASKQHKTCRKRP